MIQAVLSNADHPEYGVATSPFPSPREQYDQCIELVEALEIGAPCKKDCKVMEIDSAFSVLKLTEMLRVNLDELDYEQQSKRKSESFVRPTTMHYLRHRN